MFHPLRVSVRCALAAVLGLIFGWPAAAQAQTVATWNGNAGDGSYNNVVNWDIGVVPIDGGGNTYKAVIPGGNTVLFDVPGAGLQVTQIDLAAGGTLTIGGGRSLTVLDQAKIAGHLDTTNGQLLANHLSSTLAGNTAMVNVTTAAGRIDLAAAEYDARGISQGTILSATGAGAQLNLGTLNRINDFLDYGGGGTYVRTIAATGGGAIDLSGLQYLHGGRSSDRLEIVTQTGGSIDLSALQQIVEGNVKLITDATSLTLASLQHAAAVSYDVPDGVTIGLPELLTQNGGSYLVPTAGGTVSAPKLHTLNNASVGFEGTGTFAAGVLTDFSGSTLTMSDVPANQAFTSGALVNIDNARFLLSNGAQLSNVADSIYDARGITSGTILSATSSGTLLDLSSVDELNNYLDYGGGGAYVRTISATDGGAIDLGGMTKLHGGLNTDRLDIVTQSGGSIDLSGLEQIVEGNVTFITDATSFTLASLQHASAVTYEAPDGATISLPELLTQNGGSYLVPTAGGTVSAPKLHTLNNASVGFEGTGTFAAGVLTDFGGSTLTLNDVPANQAFTSGALVNIDNARFLLSNGAQLSNVADSIYDARGITSGTILSATSSGTLLDLSSVDELNNYLDYGGGGAYVRTISATDGGAIDLSGMTKLHGGKSTDRLDIVAQTGGSIDLSSLQTIVEGNIRFVVNGGGGIALGDLQVTPNIDMQIADSGTGASARSLTLASSAEFNLSAGAQFIIAEGDYLFKTTDESALNADTGIFQFTGDYHWMEVGGMDNGVDGTATSNFGLAQLVVGTDIKATTLLLVDVVDNGNRSSPEALYLLGSGGVDGLQLLGGSTLRIGNLPVYALIDGQMTALQDLFGPGEVLIPYTEFGSDGYLEMIEPFEVLGDANYDGLINGLDVDPFLELLHNGPYRIVADMNEDGALDALDVEPFLEVLLNGPALSVVVGGGAGAGAATVVPEPTTMLLLVMAATILVWRRL